MIATIERETLKNALAPAAKIASRSRTADLACVLLDAGEGIALEATDLNESARCAAEALVDSPGRALLPAKMLSNIAAKLPDGAVRIEAHEDSAVIKCGGAVYHVPALPPADFPAFSSIDDGASFAMPYIDFYVAAKRAVAFASRNDKRAELCGVFVESSNGKVKMTATDSYHAIEIVVTAETDGELSAIVPAGFLNDAASGMSEGTVTVKTARGKASVESDGMAMVTRLIEGNYPPVGKLMPTDFDTKATFDHKALESSLERAMFDVAGSSTATVTFTGESAKVECSGGDGSFVETLECVTDGFGTLKASAPLLRNAVSSVGFGEASIMLSGPMKPITVVGDYARAIVMPVRK